ncbi:MAG: helix-turn-helix transcriptional regulator [Oscillospiraceae bacterium]|nr:helix-turn-helix transcriptional regulator [Oscillospiraceae bacterium]
MAAIWLSVVANRAVKKRKPVKVRKTQAKLRSEKQKARYESLRGCLEKKQRVITIARMRRGWSQERLARKIYCSVSAVSRYEAGTCPAPWEELFRVMPELKEMRVKGCMAYCPFPQPCVPTGRCRYRRKGRTKSEEFFNGHL